MFSRCCNEDQGHPWSGKPLVNGAPVNLADGAALYQVLESGYNVQQWINGNGGLVPNVTKSAWYGQPYLYQLSRNIRFQVRYTF